MEDTEFRRWSTITENWWNILSIFLWIVVLGRTKSITGLMINLSGLDRIALKPGSKRALLTYLENNEQRTISCLGRWRSGRAAENYLIRYLLDHDEIGLRQNMPTYFTNWPDRWWNHLCVISRRKTESVLKNAGRQLAEFIYGYKSNKNMDNTNYSYYRAHNSGLWRDTPGNIQFYQETKNKKTSSYFRVEKIKSARWFSLALLNRCYPYQKFDSVDGSFVFGTGNTGEWSFQ